MRKEGKLFKMQKIMGGMLERFCVIQDNFLYTYVYQLSRRSDNRSKDNKEEKG